MNFDLWWKLISHDLSGTDAGDTEDDGARGAKGETKFFGLNHDAMLSGLDLPPLPMSFLTPSYYIVERVFLTSNFFLTFLSFF